MIRFTTLSHSRLLLTLMIFFLLLVAQTVYSADIRVQGDCNLYDAISAANSDKAVGKCAAGDGDDAIFLSGDLSTNSGFPHITSNIRLEGNHHDITFKSATPAFRVENARLDIKRLNIEYKNRREQSAIYVYDGELHIVDSDFENCAGTIFLLRSTARVHSDSDICDLSRHLMFSGANSDGVVVTVPSDQPSTCEALPGASVSATYGLSSGVQCNQLDDRSIGNQAIVNAGYIYAVDVWGYVEQGVDICFAQLGSIIFLDAATLPRIVAPVASYRSGNSSCASLTRPGTVVLVAGAAPSEIRTPDTTVADTTATTDTTTPATTESTSPAGQTTTVSATVPIQAGPVPDGCPIITTGNLKLRAEPSMDGEILSYVVRGSGFDVIARVPYWFQVNSHGVIGWIGGLYVGPAGDCA